MVHHMVVLEVQDILERVRPPIRTIQIRLQIRTLHIIQYMGGILQIIKVPTFKMDIDLETWRDMQV